MRFFIAYLIIVIAGIAVFLFLYEAYVYVQTQFSAYLVFEKSKGGAVFNKEQLYIMDEINKYRISKGKPIAYPDDRVCNFAQIRAKEATVDYSHFGFLNRNAHAQLPYGGTATENLANKINYKDVVKRWIASPKHEANLVDDTRFICVEKQDTVWVMEGWKPE